MSQKKYERTPERPFTDKEMRVLRALCENGDPNKVIATSLGISEGTVKVHIKSMCREVRAASRTQLVLWALRTRLVELRLAPVAGDSLGR